MNVVVCCLKKACRRPEVTIVPAVIQQAISSPENRRERGVPSTRQQEALPWNLAHLNVARPARGSANSSNKNACTVGRRAAQLSEQFRKASRIRPLPATLARGVKYYGQRDRGIAKKVFACLFFLENTAHRSGAAVSSEEGGDKFHSCDAQTLCARRRIQRACRKS